jgi:hypothetical protein
MKTKSKGDKLAAFARLEASRKLFSESIECDVERDEAMNAKYGSVLMPMTCSCQSDDC